MSLLQITDNHYSDSIEKYVPGENVDLDSVMSDLYRIANVNISNLKFDDNPNLLIFPRDLHQYGDEISESQIISMQGDKISTGNIMGFVGVNDTQLDIKSRFANNDGQDFFLHYMLLKVFAINLFDIQHSTNKQPVFDFLLYMFPYFLKKALAQGLFKKYRRFEHNDANIRGPINISRHIRENVPFKGTVAYTTREHSYDNEITQLVRHTIEYIRTKPVGASILNNDLETKECVSQIVLATQTYNAHERNKVVNQNLRPIRHPYYSEYTALQTICLRILRHESIKYGYEKDKVYGILFDGAWLWEEYLNTFLKDLGFTHPRNKVNNVGSHFFSNPKKVLVQPDFFIKDKIVLDAKYKGHESLFEDKQRADRFQILSYMHIFKANIGGLIVPKSVKESGEITGGGTMYLIGLYPESTCEDFGGYQKEMGEKEENIVKAIKELIPAE